jgi:hypothetical protein
MMVGTIMETAESGPPELQFSPAGKVVIISLIKTIIDEVDAALRQP